MNNPGTIPNMKTREFFSVKEIADMMQVSPVTIYRQIRSGNLGAANISTHRRSVFRVSREDLAAWIGGLDNKYAAGKDRPDDEHGNSEPAEEPQGVAPR